MKICLVTVNLGNFDVVDKPVTQSIPFKYYVFSDDNLPPRINSLTSRLQSKIPKFFAWQLLPNYDYYLWIDGNITLTHRDAVKYFYEQCKDYDIVAFKHFRRPDIRQEYRYTRKGIKQTRLYLYNRYKNEILKGIKDEILSDKSYIDDYLLMGGVFMYKNTLKVQEMFKNWWYFNSRYIYQDQLSFPYVVKKAGLKINIIKDNMMKSPYLSFKHHRRKK